MFDIGFSEVFVIAIVALIVLGPERLPKAARFAGLWVRRARAQWYSVKSELENELADEELKRSLRQAQDDLRQVQEQLRNSDQAVRNEVDELNRSIAAPVGAAAAQPALPAPADGGEAAAVPPAAEPAAPADDYTGAALPDYRPASTAQTPNDERR
ncbi:MULTISPECIES: Sec-independent protein translocase protein TatB [unclassified Lysobacter]|uniref:Sec-independent protein translocase protein TatB n=1 Tax=unclassified Lysobacter TaxID=2635362 RepID=UPI001BE87A22|nr:MULTISPECIES: Sec-independent protein translocase protein TatB [unclassified Lysobacter]MBT2748065.1 twin-arginine translocase subunit TatB [Lysobacter sp. ISL-42]MBT2750400.1 twin-arginine translocase subunit TatB [Lysobacter sp. ISL-50]MBT2781114.1 twin-arginine translocase subunit TatB [Lysobacter sp. ISL-52]